MGLISLLTSKREFLISEAGKSIPSNMFWGVHELKSKGLEVVELVPAQIVKRSSFFRIINKATGGYFIYFWVLLRNRRLVNSHGRLYTIAHAGAMAAVTLRALGLLNVRVVLMLTGYGMMTAGNPIARLGLAWKRWAYSKMEAIILITQLELEGFRRAMAGKPCNLVMSPLGIDLDFYRPPTDGVRERFILAIGNDNYRDWAATVKIAEACPEYQFRFITKSVNLAGLTLPPNVTPLGDPPFSASREQFQKAAVVLIVTKPSTYFSGITTVLAAMACGAVVVSDEDKSADDYGMIHGKNYLLYKRGDSQSAAAALKIGMDDKTRVSQLIAAGFENARAFNMDRFAACLNQQL